MRETELHAARIPLRPENFTDLTGDPHERYDKGMERLGSFLDSASTGIRASFAQALASFLLSAVTAAGIFAFSCLQEDAGWLLPATSLLSVFALAGSGRELFWTIRDKKAYKAMVSLSELYKQDKLSPVEQSFVYRAAGDYMRKNGQESWEANDEDFMMQRSLIQIISSKTTSPDLEIVGYCSSRHVVLIHMKSQGKDTVLPFSHCELVGEDRDDIRMTVHADQSLLSVPAGTQIPKVDIVQMSLVFTNGCLQTMLSYRVKEEFCTF